ncbi:Oidioi.mRNA.OKI2018_I69.chr2.g5514.t1.cds [Oikopleura dioica]|uniref:Oidioi.mRNA.OKI2018_I69.chr2.g5514.t1.cds n=1 Tax=Oikopleura dioica TaxID=34765 RepID=A0ABN7T034_OIKDI|nr:Oidioi.mRNA.OKI2018_I69.chr2.g5514.t1.cds [Oikopleura dioica]
MKKNLTIGLSTGEDPVMLCGGRDGFHRGCTDPPDGQYDVLASHNNWSPYVDKVLPIASKVTVIRHPLNQVVSHFHYFFHQWHRMGVKERTVEQFERALLKIRGNKIFPESQGESMKNFISQNTFDLGLSRIQPPKSTIEEAADWATDYYDLILLTERFEESIILLKDMWNLELEDVVALKAKDNAAAKTFGVADLPKNLTDFILEKNHLDLVLYEAANAELDRKIELFGKEKMEAEVEALKNAKKEAEERCGKPDLGSTQSKAPSVDHRRELTVDDELCQLLRFNGLEFTEYLKAKRKQNN